MKKIFWINLFEKNEKKKIAFVGGNNFLDIINRAIISLTNAWDKN